MLRHSLVRPNYVATGEAEPGTVTWYAFKLSDTTFGIFDTFSDEDGRQAHLNGPVAAALGQAAPGLLAKDPDIQRPDILAAT